MGIDLGRLKSPLSDPELLYKMIRELWEVQSLTSQQKKALDRGDFGGFLKILKLELFKVDDVAEKTKVKTIRIIDALKSVEANFNSYRRKLKKISKKNKSLTEQMHYVESILGEIKLIKNKMRDESGRSIREESKVRGHV